MASLAPRAPQSALLATAILLVPNALVADEGVHGEHDEFLAEAAHLLPVEAVVAEPPPAPLGNGAANGAVCGEWGPVLPWPHIPVTAANLPDGRVVTFASNERTRFPNGRPEFTYAAVWDPSTGQHTEINHNAHDMFCAHPAMLPDGRALMAGGRNAVRLVSYFDHLTNQWVQELPMNDGRWYPASTAIPDGRMVTASGSRGTGINTVERYTEGVGWQRLSNVSWTGVSTKAFSYNFIAPDGRIFCAGPESNMHWLDFEGNGVLTQTAAVFPGQRVNQSGGVAMYEPGKIVFAGGGVVGGGTTNVAHTVDINSGTPVVAPIADMHHPRRFQNALMLPDGKFLIIGGNTSGIAFSDNGTIYEAEMWDPATDVWHELAPMAIPRNYHSVALLLPDGTVFSGGGGLSSNNLTNHQDGQIFKPPYLFQSDGTPAPRPSITSAPDFARPGRTITVSASPNIARFTMVRMSATTHSFSSDVRFMEVPFTPAGAGEYDLTLHSNVNVLVPGYWMLHALDANDVPSVAKIFRVAIPSAPTIANPGNQHTFLGTGAALQMVADDVDGDPLTYSATGLPAGLSIDPVAGLITGTPTALGSGTVTVSVDDGLSAPVSTNFNWTVSQDSGLALYWPFDEGTGTTAAEIRGTGADGALQNGAGWVSAVHGTGVDFDGNNDRILAPSTPELQVGAGGAEFSVSLWLRVDAGFTGSWRAVLHKGASSTQRTFALRLRPGDNLLQASVSSTNAADNPVDSVTPVTIGQWTHVALVHRAGQWELHLDGALDASLAVDGTVISNGGPLYVGDSPWDSGAASALDELAIYDRALSTSEIAYLADNNNRPIGYNVAPAVATPAAQASTLTATVNLQISATDANGDPLTYSASGLPPGLGIGSSNGTITGTPTTPGDYTPTVTVSDGSLSTPVTFDWEVRGGLTGSPIPAGPLVAGTAHVFNVTVAGENLSYTWNFGDGSPAVVTSVPNATHSYATPGRYEVTVDVVDDLAQSVRVTFLQAIHAPPVAGAAKVSQSVIYSAAGDVWNVNPDNGTATRHHPTTFAKLTEVALGGEPRAIAEAPDGRLWVTERDGASISIIDPASNLVVGTVPLARGSAPHGIVFGASSAYIALEGLGELLELDAGTGAALGSLNVGPEPRHLSLSADGARLYVSRFVTPTVTGEQTLAPAPAPTEGGEVVVVDTATLAIASTVTLRTSTVPDGESAGRGLPNYLGPAAISPDGASAWVASKQDNIERGTGRDGNPLTFEHTVRSISSKIDLATAAEDHPARVHHDNAGIGTTALYGKWGSFVFVGLEGSRSVAVIDAANDIEIKRFITGRAPQGLALSPDGRTLFAHNFLSRTVSAHDLSQLIDGTGEDVPTLATMSAVATEVLTPNILLGKQHFYDSADTRLSLQEYISCASCHNDGAGDGRIWDFTGFGEGLRNTIDLRGRGGMAHGALHWSANFDEVQDFEGQIRGLSLGSGLIPTGSPHPPLGLPNGGRSADLDALADYVASLATTGDSPERAANGDLTAQAALGREVFRANHCASCHSGASFTDSTVTNSPLHDIGTLKPSSGNRLGGALPGIDTPTLRGLWDGAPYLHDGSAETLADAVTAHLGVTLTAPELSQLVAYLGQIDTGETSAPEPGSFAGEPRTVGPDTVALYHLDGNTLDASPNALDLALAGGASFAGDNLSWMDSPAGQVARFSSIGDALSVSIPDSLLLPGSNPLTIEAWVYPRAYLGFAIGDPEIVALEQDDDTSLKLEDNMWQTSPSVRTGYLELVGAASWASAVPTGVWSHLQLSFDGVDTVSCHIGGVLLASAQMPPNTSRTSDWLLTLGNFDGDIDEVQIRTSPGIDGGPPVPDTTPPDITLATASNNIASPFFSVSVDASESLSGFTAGDIAVTNGTVSSFSQTAFNVTAVAEGLVTVNVPGGGATDAEGNPNNASNTLNVTYAAPTNGGGGDGEPHTVGADTVALYHLDGNTTDESANSLNLALAGGAVFAGDNLGWMTTPAGQVARFSGAGDTLSVTIPDALVMPGQNGNALTIEAQIFPRAYVGYGVAEYPILKLSQDYDTSLQLEDNPWDPARGPSVRAGVAELVDATSWQTLAPAGQWHHLQISFDGTDTVECFIDGQLAGSVQSPPNVGRSNDWLLELGNFDGDIDEVLVRKSPAEPGDPPGPDTTPPSIALSTSATTVFSPTFQVTVAASEPLAGFTATDVTVTNGTVSGFTPTGFDVTAVAEGTVTVQVAAGVTTDAAGNPNLASNTVAVAYTAPTGGGGPGVPHTVGPDTVALYHFDGNTDDASPNALDLALAGGVAFTASNLGWMDTPSGQVARFASAGDVLSVTIPDALLLPGENGGPLTLEAQIFVRAYLGYGADNYPILMLSQDYDTSLQLEDNAWDPARGPSVRAGIAEIVPAASWQGVAPAGQWHHLQISFDGVDTVSCYVDGALVSAAQLPPNTGRTSDWQLEIGNFDGDIDEVLIRTSPAQAGAGGSIEITPGLAARYYAGANFDQLRFTAVDPQVDFDWGEAAPAASLPPDGFSVRWDGCIVPDEGGDYTLHLNADDGARLYVGDTLAIDAWDGAVEQSTAVTLTVGQPQPISLEYRDLTGDASVRLEWSSAALAREVVPITNLIANEVTGASGLAAAYPSRWGDWLTSAWNQNPATQPADNTDGDRYPALLEYALGESPHTGADAGHGLRTEPVGTTFEAFYRRPSAITDLAYQLEVSGDLQSWTALPVEQYLVTVLENPDGTETVRYRNIAATSGLGDALGYARLRVSLGTAEATTPVCVWGSVTAGAGHTAFGHSAARPAVLAGTVGAQNASQLVIAGVYPGAALDADDVYYLEVVSGAHEGHRFDIDPAATGAGVALDAASPRNSLASIPNDLLGASVVVRPHVTLGELFDKTQFTGAADPDFADGVLFYGDGGYTRFFLLDLGSPEWQHWAASDDGELADAGSLVVPPGTGAFFRRADGGVDRRLSVTGELRETAFAQALEQGYNLVAAPHPKAASPAGLGLTFENGFLGALEPDAADQILFWRPATESYASYFLLDAGEGTAWRFWTGVSDDELNNEDNTPLFEPLGASFLWLSESDHPGYRAPAP